MRVVHRIIAFSSLPPAILFLYLGILLPGFAAANEMAKRARRYLSRGKPLEALRLLDVAKGSETRSVVEARIDAVENLLEGALGWQARARPSMTTADAGSH